MKKITRLLLSILLITIIGGCNSKKDNNKLIIGATPVPHAEILEIAKKELAKQNIKLEIKIFSDYIKPNLSLIDEEIDANFFQHIPYLNDFNKKKKSNLIPIFSVHIEPLALYSKEYKNINELKKGATIAIPSDSVNCGRALLLLESKNLITLDKSKNLLLTPKNISNNKLDLIFKTVEAAQLPRILPDVDGAIINGNYAIQAGLNPLNDSLLIESSDSPYVNVIAIKSINKDNNNIKKLLEVLSSKVILDYINKHYKGSIVPAIKAL